LGRYGNGDDDVGDGQSCALFLRKH